VLAVGSASSGASIPNAGIGQFVGRSIGEPAIGASGGVGTGFVVQIVAFAVSFVVVFAVSFVVVFAVSFVVVKTLVVYVGRTYYVSFVRSATGTA
jgi:hypothetical protein